MRLVIMSRFLALFFYVGDLWMAPDYRSYYWWQMAEAYEIYSLSILSFVSAGVLKCLSIKPTDGLCNH